MIQAPPPAIVTPAPIIFAPPLGRSLRYVMIDRQPSERGATTVTLVQTLRFDRAPGGLIATQMLVQSAVEAPPRVKAALEALEAAFQGVSLRLSLTGDGVPGAVIDAERSWANVAASFAALERKAAEPGMTTPAELALLRALVAGQMPRTAADRDARLRDSVALLLPPPLPALRPAETRGFTTTIAAPGAPLPADGMTTLVAATTERLAYHVEVVADRAAARASAASLRMRAAPDMAPAERSRIEALAASLEAGTFSERIDIELDPRTGLLSRLHSQRFITEGQAPPRLVTERIIERQSEVL